MKKLISFLFFVGSVIMTNNALAQITYNPTVRSKNNPCIIEKVEIADKDMIVYLKIPSKAYRGVSISDATIRFPTNEEVLNLWGNPKFILDLRYYENMGSGGNIELYKSVLNTVRQRRDEFRNAGLMIKKLGGDRKLSTYYRLNRKVDYETWILYFEPLPVGIEDISIRELNENGWEWIGIKINNPYPTVQNTGYNETSIKSVIDSQNDGIVGIYKSVSQETNQYKLACYKDGSTYKLVYLDSKEKLPQWKIGDVKATLTPTATPTMYSSAWRMADKTLNSDCYVKFEGNAMKTFVDGDEELYIKLYPTADSNFGAGGSANGSKWSGTGFAIGHNFIVTNHHVIDGAKTIKIKGVKGNFDVQYQAEVIASDRNNDLALMKITDSQFTGFANIPYATKTTLSDVGENIFVLGYPLTSTMGEEIKLTTGVISSRSGFQGDIASYQISAPVQPGNSGGPLFDSKGNLIGVVSAKHTQAENAGYAVKVSYLKILIENAVGHITLPSNNQISNLPLTEKIKKVDDYIFLIECSK